MTKFGINHVFVPLIFCSVFALSTSCVPNSKDSQTKHHQALAPAPQTPEATLSCSLKRSVGSVIEYPLVHVTKAKGIEVLIYGYAQIDLSFRSLQGLFSPGRTMEVPPQKFMVVINPSAGAIKTFRDNIERVGCVADLEEIMVEILAQSRDQAYLSVLTPKMKAQINLSSRSICDMKLESIGLENLQGLEVKVFNPQESWWGKIGTLLNEPVAALLKSTLVAKVANEGTIDFMLSLFSEAFAADALLGVKKSLGCNPPRP